MAAKKQRKRHSSKRGDATLWQDDDWVVRTGRLVPRPGRPPKVKSLFRHVAEKLPYDCLNAVAAEFRANGWASEGVYVAHDSMGFARYVGRGYIFARLRARYRVARKELAYFSFYVVSNKSHEREIETLLIRLGGANLHFNTKKKRVDIAAGNVRDYEAGTRYVERRRRRGRKK